MLEKRERIAIMPPPTILFLNGTSSAGKTSLANALQTVLEEPYLYFSADIRKPLLPPYREDRDWNVSDILDHLREGYWRCLGALWQAGNYVIADQAIEGQEALEQCARLLAPLPAYFIGVRCPLEIVLQRERERGDRRVGLVEEHFEKVHQNAVYDLEVDTSTASASECAHQIKDFVAQQEPRAFRILSQTDI